DPDRETATDRATAIMSAVAGGQLDVLQPFHWLAEVAAVLCRLSPDTAQEDTLRLRALRLEQTDEPAVLRRACELALRHGTHVFDSLYHAIALEESDAVLLTADRSYARAAGGAGRIITLDAWQEPA